MRHGLRKRTLPAQFQSLPPASKGSYNSGSTSTSDPQPQMSSVDDKDRVRTVIGSVVGIVVATLVFAVAVLSHRWWFSRNRPAGYSEPLALEPYILTSQSVQHNLPHENTAPKSDQTSSTKRCSSISVPVVSSYWAWRSLPRAQGYEPSLHPVESGNPLLSEVRRYS